MKIIKGNKYIALKDIRSNKQKIVFTNGAIYTAVKNDNLVGDDGVSYSFPPHRLLNQWFKAQKGEEV